MVQHIRDSQFVVFHEEDDFHEEWELPDAELVFLRESEDGHMHTVTRDMLPHV